MTINLKLFPAHDLAVFKAHGVLTGSQMICMGEDLLSKTQGSAGLDIIYDYRDVTAFDVSFEEVEQLAKKNAHYMELLHHSRIAVVAPTDIGYGIARMWEAMSSDSPMEMMVCRDLLHACKWLHREVDDVQQCCQMAAQD
jgi:hypothetical protein